MSIRPGWRWASSQVYRRTCQRRLPLRDRIEPDCIRIRSPEAWVWSDGYGWVARREGGIMGDEDRRFPTRSDAMRWAEGEDA